MKRTSLIQHSAFSIQHFIKFVLVLVIVLVYKTSISQSQPAFPYLNTNLTFEERAADLVSRMTLEEKILQMQNISPEIKRLGINNYDWWSECLHGVCGEKNVTVFPQVISMSATFNPDLIYKEGVAVSSEARALYNESLKKNSKISPKGLTYWAPNVNIFRDPRWGRGQETYGEDPYLTSIMSVAYIKGLQGSDPKYLKVVATPKHYAAHSGPESSRHTDDIHTSKRDLYDTYLPAFEACIRDGKAYSIMGAYTRYMGVPCCASNFLLDDILRKKWGFKGFVVSDCGAIGDIYNGHKFSPDAASGTALAVKAGCDLTCGGEYVALNDAVKKGLVTEKEIDICVKRLMLGRMKLGMFDPPEMVPYSKIPFSYVDNKENRSLALKIAKEGMVLLKNNGILPLDKNKIKSIAVIGPNADELPVLYGNYNGIPSKAVSVLEGIKLKTKDLRLTTNYAKGCNLIMIQNNTFTIPTANLKGGLKAEYYNNMTLEGKPVLVRVDKTVDFDWGQDSPDKKVNSNNFSVRWTGKIVPDLTGEHEIAFTGDDGYRVYVNNKLEFESWQDQGPFLKSYKVNLVAGKEYDIKIEYYENGGGAVAKLTWAYPGAHEKIKKDFDDKMREELNNAKAIAAKSDVVIFVGGISSQLEGEQMNVNTEGFFGGDRTNLNLPDMQDKLLREIYSTGKPVILVLMNGSALAINWAKENIPAILEAWYPGEEGGNAVADVLFGDYNPAGRLPITFYQSHKDLPSFGDYNMQGRTYRYFKGEPLYPFGFGLSYSKFDYSGLKLSNNNIIKNDSVLISVNVKNIGNYDGDEVVQLYVKQVERSFLTTLPLKDLRGFKRVNLKKGETKTVQLSLKAEQLRYFDEEKNTYVIWPGKYEIQVGASSEDIRLKDNLIVE